MLCNRCRSPKQWSIVVTNECYYNHCYIAAKGIFFLQDRRRDEKGFVSITKQKDKK